MYHIKNLFFIGSDRKACGTLYLDDEMVCWFYELYDDEKFDKETYRVQPAGPLFDEIENIDELIHDTVIKQRNDDGHW